MITVCYDSSRPDYVGSSRSMGFSNGVDAKVLSFKIFATDYEGAAEEFETDHVSMLDKYQICLMRGLVGPTTTKVYPEKEGLGGLEE